MDTKKVMLKVDNLETTFFSDKGNIPAVDNVSFHINDGEVLGIVGESGCGKSATALSVMGLIPNPPGKIVGGEIHFNGDNLLDLSERKMRQIRGNDIAMIFQEPMTSLNPVFTIGNQMMETLLIHEKKISKKKAKERCIEMLHLVGLARGEALMNEYPHQLSGGMRQRVMIAMALICNPKVLIADEPTTALDVTTQAQILKLIKNLNKKIDTAVMLITHDLGVVAETCERVVVMYSGQVIEEAPVKKLFASPKHPYTQGLIESVPDVRTKRDRLFSIEGNVPVPGSIQKGCRFAPRCKFAFDRCTVEDPGLYDTSEGQQARCFLYDKQEVENSDGALTRS